MPDWWFDLAVLAYQETVGKEQKLFRPFFVFDTEDVRDFDPAPILNGKDPSGIKIDETIDGNGAQGAEWIVKLGEEGP